MSQADLFDAPAVDQRPARNGWIAHAKPGARVMQWSHWSLPGVMVHHCGHATARRPYYLTGANTPRKFCTLAEAQAWAFNPGDEGA